MITFETIRWKNFLSTGDQWTEIQLNESQSTLIVGTNGAGKSTMLDALCFALFGKAFRKINKPQLVNSINEKGCKVEVTFSIGKDEYRVFRAIKPNAFELYKNNKLVDQDAATKDTQKYLEQSVLKLNFKSFTQVVILGSSTFVPFMQLAASHRREVIEDLLDINIFSNMNALLKDRVRTEQSHSRDCEHMVSIAEERVASQTKLIESLQEVNNTRQKEKQDRIVSNQKLIDDEVNNKAKYTEQLSEIKESLEGVDDHKKILHELRQSQSDVNSELKSVSKQLKFFKANDECPTCQQEIDKNFKFAMVGSLKVKGEDLSENFRGLTDKISDAISVIETIESISKKSFELNTRIQRSDKEIVRIEFENLGISKELLNLQNDTPSINSEVESLESLKNQLNDTKEQCGKVSKTLVEYQVVSNLLKDSGIKSQIIKKYIPVFNNLINKYLQSMDFFVNFTLDEEFNEIIRSRFRDVFSYASFSEGEKQKIDLALLFTWREVARMKNSVSTNLLILDEVFDSSLDSSATAELLSILRSLGNETNLFVISHKGEILVDKFLRTIKFEKINDFSKMSDDS